MEQEILKAFIDFEIIALDWIKLAKKEFIKGFVKYNSGRIVCYLSENGDGSFSFMDFEISFFGAARISFQPRKIGLLPVIIEKAQELLAEEKVKSSLVGEKEIEEKKERRRKELLKELESLGGNNARS